LDVFDLTAKISLFTDDFTRGIDAAAKTFSAFSDKIGAISSHLADGFKAVESVGSKAADVVTGGLEALAGAATVAAGSAAMVGKSAFDAYASYEQLVGGVETLFKEYADSVMENASNAYKTAGMSANEYMETVSGFAASLRQSLGDDYFWQIANYADQAVTDMSDNANKMGTDMGRITDAYQGFAKQNYTMLDNLKLGYGGTKSEMERLLADAEKLEGYAEGSFSVENFADIVDAIHIIQEEMGITGTTAKEASTTIEGSVASMKGAWENFAVGIATADYIDDYEALTNDLIETVITAGNNIVPRIQEIAERGLELIPYLVNGIAEAIPEFARMGAEIVQTLADGISAQIPTLLEFGSQAIGAISDGIVKYAPNVGGAVSGLLTDIVDMIGGQSEKLAAAGSTIIETILSGFLDTIDTVSQYVDDFIPLIAEAFAAKHEALFTAGLEILGAIGEGLVKNKEKIENIASDTIGNMVDALTENAPDIIDGAIALLDVLIKGVEDNWEKIKEAGKTIIGHLVSSLSEASTEVGIIVGVAVLPHIFKIVETVGQIGGAVKKVVDFIGGADGIKKIMDVGKKLMGGISKLFTLITAHPVIAVVTAVIAAVVLLWTKCEWFRDGVKAALEAIGNFFSSAWETIQTAWDDAVEFFGNIVDGITGVFDGIGEFLGGLFTGAWETVQSAWDAAVGFFSGIGEGIQSLFETVTEFLGSAFSEAWAAVSGAWSTAVEFFGGIWSSIKEGGATATEKVKGAFEDGWNNIKTAWDNATDFFSGIFDSIVGVFSGIGDEFLSIGGDIVDGIKSGIGDAWENFVSWLSSKIDGIVDTVKNLLGIHSPSKVFAGIGENMALGLAEGWDDEYSSIKRQIENGLDFGTASVGVSANQIGGNASGSTLGGAQPGFSGNNSFTYIFNSPKTLDPIEAARKAKQASQMLAMGFV